MSGAEPAGPAARAEARAVPLVTVLAPRGATTDAIVDRGVAPALTAASDASVLTVDATTSAVLPGRAGTAPTAVTAVPVRAAETAGARRSVPGAATGGDTLRAPGRAETVRSGTIAARSRGTRPAPRSRRT